MPFFKRMREGNPQRVLNELLPITAKRIVATRALYHGEGFERIEMRIETPMDDILVIDMSPKQAHELILQLSLAYNVINPPLTNPRPNFQP